MTSLLGILKQDFGWQQILEQEGIIYNVLSNIASDYSAPIIINRNLEKSEILIIQNYLKNGGAILTDFPNLAKITDNFDYKPTRISHLFSDNSDIFNNISVIDLHIKGYKGNIYQGNYGKGCIIALPFDVNEAICDTRNERKPFYYPSRKFPNEIVSKVSKGEIRKLIINCIRKLFAKMNLPYVHLWYYPDSFQSAFAFRVDTDFGPEDTLKTTFDLEGKKGIDFTYFINCKAHSDPFGTYKTSALSASSAVDDSSARLKPCPTNNSALSASSAVKNKSALSASHIFNKIPDFQIHCFEHEVYKNYQTNFDNIKKAKTILENAGIKPIGFVSPYGFWNENLQKAIEDLDIKYSSEFSLAYDDLPFYPILENRRSKVLQIPVHPICIGRLVHVSLTKENCIDYYSRYFVQQLQANEPIFIYDHPHRIAQFPDVFSEVLNNAKKLPDIWLTNMTEFYHWWKKRLQIYKASSWEIENNILKIGSRMLQLAQSKDCDYQDYKPSLHIITPDNKQTFIPLKQTLYNLQDLKYKSITMAQNPDIKEYKRLKSTGAKLQMKFYRTVDKILKLLER